ncbi:MAG TPA: ATP-binding protein [Bacteroidota bacterium]|nr:ATP-binding protein [Bacteroidota bacterium]
MEDLSLHILDIAENAVAAGSRLIRISITEDAARDLLSLEVSDDGNGLRREELEKAADPFFSTKSGHRTGLGLALLHQAAIEANGTMELRSVPGRGTTVSASFQASHPDRKPVGNMVDTITALLNACQDLSLVYVHSRDGKRIVFDSREMREELAGAPVHSAKAQMVIHGYLNQEEESLTH